MPISPAAKESRAAAKRFEKAIGDALEWDKLRGLVAFYEHTEPAYRRIGAGFMPVKQGPADYSGFLCNGLALAIEAKSSATGARYRKNQIHERQVEHLEALDRAGGLAFLAIEFRTAGASASVPKRFLVPWHAIPWTAARTALSIGPEELEPWAMPWKGSVLERYVHRCAPCGELLRWDNVRHSCAAGAPPF